MKRDYEVKIVLKILVKDVENENDVVEYIDNFLYGLSDMVYLTNEYDNYYNISSTKVLSVIEVNWVKIINTPLPIII